MDEALNMDNNVTHNNKGQEAWRMNLAMMHRQCPICNKKKGNCHFPTQLHLNPPCLECKHAWKPVGIKYNGTALKGPMEKRSFDFWELDTTCGWIALPKEDT